MSSGILSQAIAQRRVIELHALHHRRIGEPHLIGIARNGIEQVELYQTGGGSSRGNLPEWRRFNVEDVTSVLLLDESFTRRDSFNSDDPYWEQVITSV